MNNTAKKILVVCGIFHGHFTTSVEVVRELVALGYDVTCYVNEEFAPRLNVENVKKVVYSDDVSDMKSFIPADAPAFAITHVVSEKLLTK